MRICEKAEFKEYECYNNHTILQANLGRAGQGRLHDDGGVGDVRRDALVRENLGTIQVDLVRHLAW